MADFEPDRSSETVYRIPPSHHHCHLHNFEWGAVEGGEALRREVRDFLQTARGEEAPHLIMTGRNGRGKSHIIYGIYRAMVFKWDLVRAVVLNVPEFCDRVKSSFGDEGALDPFEEVRGAEFLGVDDLFGRDLTEWDQSQVVPRLIDIAYRNGAALAVTANPDLDGIADRLRPHEASRLLDSAVHLCFRGEDWRVVR